MRRNSQR